MKKRIFALLLSITLLFSAVVTPVSAESINNFTVKVSDATATAGDDRVAVDILLEDNPGIAGFSFCVNYDTEKLVLVESKINIEDGYKVVAQPTGYGVNLAWTGPSGYSADGKIATLYFNIPKDLTASEANVDIVYRSGYDSFYDSHEHDIAVQTVNGKVSIAALQETNKPSVNVGGVSVNFGATDIVVPITVKNNPGFSGFSFCVNYDTSRLVLESTNILLDGGYKVIGHPEGYGVNIAWTSTEAYTEDGTIAELHFSLTDDPNSGKAYINTAFRDGYDSFYGFTNGTEQDIAFDAFNGYVDVNNHHFGEWVVTTPATCTATGLKTRTCSDCSKTETVVIPKVDHEYAAVVTDPTCTAKGYTTHTCKTCPDYYIDTYVDMVDHTLGEWEQSIAPECDVKGEEIQKCAVCKATINTRTVDETGHDFDDWYVVTEAKFNEDGQERRDCKNCDHFETKRIPKLSESHTCDYSGREEIIENATCTVNGSKKVFCTETECGKFEIVEIVAPGHSLGDWYVVTEAKFNEDGQERRDCANCDYFETKRLPKLSETHVCNFIGREEIVEDATCTVSGSKKVYCNVTECGKYTTVNIDPIGHYEGEWEIKDSATCTGTGTKVKKCTVCGEELQSQPIDANGHDWDDGTVTTSPDCLNEGVKTFHCSNCTETKTEAIDATGHTEGEWNVASAATCTVAGTKEKRCTVCQALIATETIPATGHSLGDWYEYKKAEFHTDGEERKDCANCDYFESRRIPKLSESHICAFTGTEEIVSNPTCTQSGSKKVYCYEAACGKFTTVDIDPTGHTSGVWEVEKAATCTEAGTEVIKCTVCKTVLQSRGIEATGHSWDGGAVTTVPDCLNEGIKTFHCANCSETKTEAINATGHTEGEWNVASAATCTVAGTKEKRCTVCQALVATETILATGHSLGDWYEYKKAEFHTDGEERKDCANCDYYESRRIPKLSESHICAFTGTEEIVSNPTCTQSGSKKVYCYEAACGKFTTVDIDPTGHISGVWEVEKAATCTEAGTEVIKCTVCKTVLQSRGIEATGHSWDTGVVTKEANCLNEGEKTFTCSVCSAKDVKKIPTGGHTEGEWEVTDSATCTETGTKELHCTVCEQLLGTDTIAATGHKYGSWVVTTQPTATTAGEKSRECSVCHDVQTSPIDPTGELPKIVVSSTKGSVGNTVKVTISLQDNPGIITASLNVGYDATKLQLISAEDTGLLNDSIFSNDLTLNPYVLCWDDALATSNNSSNGEIVTLTFKVLQSDACKTDIVVTFEEDEIYDMNLDPVFFETQNGQVEIVDFIFGDVDGDGVCNIRDATILRRYVAKWDGVTVNELAADVNNDGIVNIRDATILRRHVAKWGGYEDLPYTS